MDTPRNQGPDATLTSLEAAAVSARGLKPLVVQAGERSWVVGTGETTATGAEEDVVRVVNERLAATLLSSSPPPAGGLVDEPAVALVASPFELFRALTGRRSVAQILQLDWPVDPAPYLPAFQFGPFTLPGSDIVE